MKAIISFLGILIITLSCEKQATWLDVKSNKADVVPTSLKDFQAILDNHNVMNSGPSLGLLGTDNYFVSDVIAKTSGNASERNAYIWAPDIWEGLTGIATSDWGDPYETVEYANIVLEGIASLEREKGDQQLFDNVRGSALFFRANAFHNLVQLFAKPYSANAAGHDLGIPIRLTGDVNKKSVRATVKETYEQILTDLKEAAILLPNQPLYKTRPSRYTANALLAKVYLNMEDYTAALHYANEALMGSHSLLDFNTIDPNPTFPFPTYEKDNPEIMLYGTASSYLFFVLSIMQPNEELYSQYVDNDLRKTLFFRVNGNGTKSFRGRYSGTSPLFCGIAINEIYLIKAECEVREGSVDQGMATLNLLLEKRWVSGSFHPLHAADETQALKIILDERRKELPFTGNLRWEDLRRLNKDPRFAQTLTRTLEGQTYRLLPNDPKYVYPIPPLEIRVSGMEQNVRK